MADALSLPVAEIASLLGEGKLTARALAEQAIANHERFGTSLRAYSQWAPEHARKCAGAADAAFAVGSRAGSLQGIPTSIKDLFAVAGFATYAGSPKRLPPKFEIDGPVIASLRRQLATVMGKTHMVEFAFGGTGHNAHYGSPRNPWDAKAHRAPGGSSSGAGVSLCEGSALLAFGTDTAASVRLPAAMTGNAGLKFTKDRWSTEGIVPLSFTFDTPGILARMADAGFSFAALDPCLGDGFAFLRRVPTGVDGIRIGIADAWFWDGCENGIDEIVRSAIDTLARAGARVKQAPLPEAREAFAVFAEGGVSGIELRAFLDRELPDWLATIDPVNAPALKNAESLSAREYLTRRLRLLDAAKSAAVRFEDVDVIATPTVMLSPPVLTEEASAEKFWALNRKIVHNLAPVNYLTLCAATLPVGLDRLGMPVGLQLIAKGGDDERLVATACAAERILGTPRQVLGTPPMCS
jgi:aspartyl-tRNA(Asn)/glutamyl-tRNA(Gln) amidotransferase subunit A